MPKQTTESIRSQVVGMWRGKLRQEDIASALSISQSAVSKIIQKFKKTGSVSRRKGSGRHRLTTARTDRHLIRMIKKERKRTATSIQNEVTQLIDHPVSRQTINLRLIRGDYRARRPLRKPKRNERQKRARRQWAEAYRNWTDQQWRRVVFTDESCFELRHVDRRMRVRRLTGEAMRSDCIDETVAHGGGNVQVWGAITMDAKSDLVVLVTTITGQSYRLLLEQCALPFARQRLGNHFYYQDDNAPPHRSGAVKAFLAQEGIQCLPWPAQSPDLNVIEHMWDELGRRIQKRDPPPNTLQQLRGALKEEWDAIPQAYVRKLVRSMPDRVKAVLKSKGSHTRF